MKAEVSITRPANTTAYTTGDVINANGSTTPILLSYPSGFAQNPWLIYNHLISSNEAGTPAIDVHFYKDTFTIAVDNAAFAPTDAQEKDNYLGTVSHTTWAAWAANKKSNQKPDAPIALNAGAGCYIVMTAAAAYTPISGEVITIKSDID